MMYPETETMSIATHLNQQCSSRSRHSRMGAWAMLGWLAFGISASAAETVVVTLVTGSDDLRGGNDNVHVRLIDVEGRRVAQRVNANNSGRWSDGSTHDVSITLDRVRVDQLSAIELETTFGGGMGGDNWNLDRLSLSGGGKALFEARGAPLFRFTGDQKTQRFAFAVNQCEVDDDCSDGRIANGEELCVSAVRAMDGMQVKQCKAGLALACPVGSVPSREDGRCVISQIDADGDGSASVTSGGSDCDDQDARRYPGGVEVCDYQGSDEDCDVSTVGHLDADRDGHNSSQCFNWGPPPGR